MARYSLERKEVIFKKMAPPHIMSRAELASQEGISITVNDMEQGQLNSKKKALKLYTSPLNIC
ncbi:MAG TPA: hypothetical protein VFD11_01980 [Thiopseudomonas sp.]|nr:hypothetical protein [Thiopseudomonas sp.]